MAKQAASRTLDYSLSADILNRVKAAGEDKMAGEFGLEKVGETISKGLIGIDKARKEEAKKAEEEARKAEEDRYKLEEGWNASFEKFGARSSWATPELFEMFATNEAKYKDDYLAAVEAEDTIGAEKILKQQQQRSASIQGWKTAFLENQDAWENKVYSASLSDEDRHVMMALNSQEPGTYEIAVDDENEVYFKIKGPHGLDKEVRLQDLNDMMANNMKATNEAEEFAQSNKSFLEAGKKDPSGDVGEESLAWNEGEVYHKNSKLINKNNIRSLFYDDMFGAKPFAQTVLDHPEFSTITPKSDIKLGPPGQSFAGAANLSSDADKAAEDGKIDPQEFMQLSIEDKNAVVALMMEPENFETAKGYLAEYMTLINKQNFDKGRGARKQVMAGPGTYTQKMKNLGDE